jgi:predicted peroxiredoxin
MKILSIVETAYRATLEEQDDTILWINHVLKNAGADVSLLLRGSAVNYAARGQDATGLAFGARRQSRPPALDKDLEKMIGAGVAVYTVAEDMRDCGLSSEDIIGGTTALGRAEIPALFDRFDQVWHW